MFLDVLDLGFQDFLGRNVDGKKSPTPLFSGNEMSKGSRITDDGGTFACDFVHYYDHSIYTCQRMEFSNEGSKYPTLT
jgi:hypothetical protein